MKQALGMMIIVLSIQAHACYNDYDCGSGNKCVKSLGNYAGVGTCMAPVQRQVQVDTSMYHNLYNPEDVSSAYQNGQMQALQRQKLQLEIQRMQQGQ